MKKGDRYIVKTEYRVGKIQILFVGEFCIKVKWNNKSTEWFYRGDFKERNNYTYPKIKIIEKIRSALLNSDQNVQECDATEVP